MKRLALLVSHVAALAIGFALGIYALPILIAPDAPSAAEVQSQAGTAAHQGQFRRDLKDSDALHWGEGTVSVSAKSIGLAGELAPGPDYKLYLSPKFIETEAEFKLLKASMVRVGDVKTFKNFLLAVPETVDVEKYNTVVIWCETFGKYVLGATNTGTIGRVTGRGGKAALAADSPNSSSWPAPSSRAFSPSLACSSASAARHQTECAPRRIRQSQAAGPVAGFVVSLPLLVLVLVCLVWIFHPDEAAAQGALFSRGAGHHQFSDEGGSALGADSIFVANLSDAIDGRRIAKDQLDFSVIELLGDFHANASNSALELAWFLNRFNVRIHRIFIEEAILLVCHESKTDRVNVGSARPDIHDNGVSGNRAIVAPRILTNDDGSKSDLWPVSRQKGGVGDSGRLIGRLCGFLGFSESQEDKERNNAADNYSGGSHYVHEPGPLRHVLLSPKVFALFAGFVAGFVASCCCFLRALGAAGCGRWWRAGGWFMSLYLCAAASAWCTALIGDLLPY